MLKNKPFTVPSSIISLCVETAKCFCRLRQSPDHQHNIFKCGENATHIYSPCGLPLQDPTCLRYLLQYESCKIIVDLGKKYNDNNKILNCKTKFQTEEDIYFFDTLFMCVCSFVQILLFGLLSQILQWTVCHWKPPTKILVSAITFPSIYKKW